MWPRLHLLLRGRPLAIERGRYPRCCATLGKHRLYKIKIYLYIADHSKAFIYICLTQYNIYKLNFIKHLCHPWLHWIHTFHYSHLSMPSFCLPVLKPAYNMLPVFLNWANLAPFLRGTTYALSLLLGHVSSP